MRKYSGGWKLGDVDLGVVPVWEGPTAVDFRTGSAKIVEGPANVGLIVLWVDEIAAGSVDQDSRTVERFLD